MTTSDVFRIQESASTAAAADTDGQVEVAKLSRIGETSSTVGRQASLSGQQLPVQRRRRKKQCV